MTGRRKVLAGSLLLLAGAPLVGLGFGWRTVDSSERGILRYQRILGREVILTIDENRDGRVDGRYVYSWLRPADEPAIGSNNMHKPERVGEHIGDRRTARVGPAAELW